MTELTKDIKNAANNNPVFLKRENKSDKSEKNKMSPAEVKSKDNEM